MIIIIIIISVIITIIIIDTIIMYFITLSLIIGVMLSEVNLQYQLAPVCSLPLHNLNYYATDV